MSAAPSNPLDHPSSAEPGLVVGVDVGGTKIAAGLVNQCGTILYQTRIPMISDSGADCALAAVRAVIDCVAAQARLQPSSQGSVRAIGICSPGPLNPVPELS